MVAKSLNTIFDKIESDFEPPVPSQLEFGVGVTTTCTNIMTIDDDVYEYDESFTVYLSPVTDNVNISFNTTRVIIINDDSKHILCGNAQ